MKSKSTLATLLLTLVLLSLLGCPNPAIFKCDPASGADCEGGTGGTGATGGAGGAGGGGNSTLTVSAKRTLRPPSIDGRPGEDVWDLSESVSRTTSGTNNNASTFGVLWDDTYLYVAAKVLDSDLQNDSELAWFDDSVEVYVDGEGERSTSYDGNDFHFIKGWNDTTLTVLPTRGATGVLHATADISGGYAVELAIPWSTLSVIPTADKLLGFDVQQNDDESGGAAGERNGAASWNTTVDTNHLSTAEFGRLTLSPELVGATGAGGGTGGGTAGGAGGGTDGVTGGGTGGGAGGGPWHALPLRTQAQKTAGLPGGEGFQGIFGMVYAPSNGDVAYAVTDTSRVWKSVDRGQSWVLKSRGIPSNGGVSVVVSPSDENRVLMAASLHGSRAGSAADGIYLTTNGGDLWRQVQTTHFYRQRSGTHFAFSKTPGLVYAATHDLGVLKSTDNGETWRALNVLSAQMLSDIEPHPSNPAVVYVAAPSGLFRVTDQAQATAQRVGAGLAGNPEDILVVPTSPPTLYASANNRGVFKSTDGGDSFVAKSSGLDAVLAANPIARVRYLGQSSKNPRRLYASISGLALLRQPFWSDDGGEHWHEADHMDSGGLFADLSSWTTNRGSDAGSPIAAHPSAEGTALTLASPGHPVMTTDGGKTWRYSGNGYTGGASRFGNHGLGWNDSRRFAVFLDDYGVFLTENAGDTFRAINLPNYKGREDSGLGAADPTPGSKAMLAIVGEILTGAQPVLAITQDGTNWTLLERDAAGNSMEDDYQFSTLAFNPQSPNTIYAKRFRSMDKGRTWTRLTRDIDALFPGNGSIVYSRDRDALGCTVYKSTDSGSTWSQPLGHFSPCSFGTMAVDPRDQNRLYVASRNQGVYVYDGARWALKAEAEGLSKDHFGQFSLMLVAADPRPTSSTVYAAGFAGSVGHSNGIFRSTDRGASWQSISDNLGPEFNVNSMQVNPWDGRVFIGSFAGTWWRAPPP